MAVKIGEAFVEFTARRAKVFDDTAKKVRQEAAATAKAASGATIPHSATSGPAKTAQQAWDEMLNSAKGATEAAAEGAAATAEGVGSIAPAAAGAAAALGPVALGIGAVVVGLKLVAAIVPQLKQASDELKSLKVAGDVAGYTGSELSSMAYAMERATSDLGGFISLRQQWNSQILDLQYGTGHAGAALRILGVRATDSKGQLRELADVLPEISAALEKYNAVDRQRIASALFGGGSETFLKMLSQGADAMERMQASAKALGITVNQSTVDAGAQVSDTWGTLGSEIKSLWQNLVAAVSPILTPVLATLVVIIGGFNRLLGYFNAVVVKPITALFSLIGRAFSTGAMWADRVASKLGWMKKIADWLLGGGKAEDNSTANLGRGQLAVLQGGGFGATIGGLVDFSRNMVQNAAGAMSVGEASLSELKQANGHLAHIAGQVGGGQIAAVGP